MVFVEREAVGGLSYARLVRDRLITPVRAGIGAIHDVPVSPGVRASVLAADVPGRVTVSGIAGWWIWSGSGTMRRVLALAPRGTHVRPRVSEGLPLEVHAVDPLPDSTLHSGVRVAGPQRCIADALRWEEVDDAAALHAALARFLGSSAQPYAPSDGH